MSRTLVMGILNITPDSFADGGKYLSKADAITQGRRLIAEGADIIDVGGESTRPGANRVTEEEELARVIPVITELVKDGAIISVDTMRSAVATAAIKAGALYVNDVSGGLADEKMAKLIANNPKIQYIVMHWRGHSKDMQKQAVYTDVVKEVMDELDERVSLLLKSGVLAEQIILDPGIGFAKESDHNWKILQNIERLQLLGYPLLIGASRKRFLGELLNTSDTDSREAATIALTTELARLKIWGVRTHTVKAHQDAISVIEQLRK
ncbi:MAG: dihydropteroate synthase [Actinomycetota bacterium]